MQPRASCRSCCNGKPARSVLMGAPPPLLEIIPHLPCPQVSAHPQQGERPGPPPCLPAPQLPSLGNSPSLSLPPSLALWHPSLLHLWVEPAGQFLPPVLCFCDLPLTQQALEAILQGLWGTLRLLNPRTLQFPLASRCAPALSSNPMASLHGGLDRPPPSWTLHLGSWLAS